MRPPEEAPCAGAMLASYSKSIPDASMNFFSRSVPVPVSCTALTRTCGASQTSACCDSIVVPGGSFYRGYDVAADPLSGDMGAPATLGPFRLDIGEKLLSRDGTTLPLEPTQLQVLTVLVRGAGHLVTRDDLTHAELLGRLEHQYDALAMRIAQRGERGRGALPGRR